MKKLLLAVPFMLIASLAWAGQTYNPGGGASLSDSSVDTWLGATGTDTGVPVRAADGSYSLGALDAAAAAGSTTQMQYNNEDVLAGTALLTVGTTALSQGLTTFTAKPTFVTVGTTTASINIPVGTQAPSSPVSGDVWVTDGMYVQVGTTTQGPLGAGGGVPYTGATDDVDIGTHTMSAASFISTSGTDSSVTFANDMALDGTASTKLDILAPAGGVLVSVGSTGNVTLGAGQSITLTGGTSGTLTLGVPVAAGTSTIFTLPATNGTDGYFLKTNGSGVTSWDAAGLVAAGSNTVLANFTASSAVPSANAVPACATDGAHALTYTNGTGLSCTAVTGGAATDIAIGTTTVTGGSSGQVLAIGSTGVVIGTTVSGGTSGLGTPRDATTNDTLVIGDANAAITLTSASAITETVPPNSSVDFPVGTQISVIQMGSGSASIVDGSGVTLLYTSTLTFKGQYSRVILTQIADDTWLVDGGVQ